MLRLIIFYELIVVLLIKSFLLCLELLILLSSRTCSTSILIHYFHHLFELIRLIWLISRQHLSLRSEFLKSCFNRGLVWNLIMARGLRLDLIDFLNRLRNLKSIFGLIHRLLYTCLHVISHGWPIIFLKLAHTLNMLLLRLHLNWWLILSFNIMIGTLSTH